MKRILAGLLLSMLLLTAITSGIADNETPTYSYTPTLTGMFEYSASEWYSTSVNRALLTITTLLDIGAFTEDETVQSQTIEAVQYAMDHNSYVGKSGFNLLIAVPINATKWIVVQYNPIQSNANKYGITAGSEAGVLSAFGSGSWVYEKNDKSSLETVLTLFLQAVQD